MQVRSGRPAGGPLVSDEVTASDDLPARYPWRVTRQVPVVGRIPVAVEDDDVVAVARAPWVQVDDAGVGGHDSSSVRPRDVDPSVDSVRVRTAVIGWLQVKRRALEWLAYATESARRLWPCEDSIASAGGPDGDVVLLLQSSHLRVDGRALRLDLCILLSESGLELLGRRYRRLLRGHVLLQVGLSRDLLLKKRGHLASLYGEVGVGLVEPRPLLAELAEQLAIRSGDLLGADHSVHEVVERVRCQDQLDVVHRAMVVDIPQPLVEDLVTHAHLRMQPREAGFGEADLHVEIVNRGLSLCDQILLGRNLRVEAVDQRVDGVDLSLCIRDLVLDVLQLLLVIDLGANALVVPQTCLVDVGRVARVAIDRGSRLRRQRDPGKEPRQHRRQQADAPHHSFTNLRTPK